MKTKADLEETVIEAVIIRKDGSQENLGVIAYYHRNILKRWWYAFRKRLDTWQVF